MNTSKGTMTEGYEPQRGAAATGEPTRSGAPRRLLQAEGLAVLTLTTAIYAQTGAGWWVFAALFLAPDVFMVGYLRNRKVGAALYNAGHTYLVPLALGLAGHVTDNALMMSLALIWIGHIGFDRMIGYGLKYDDAFARSHLDRV